jgi:hypothetical protein
MIQSSIPIPQLHFDFLSTEIIYDMHYFVDWILAFLNVNDLLYWVLY